MNDGQVVSNVDLTKEMLAEVLPPTPEVVEKENRGDDLPGETVSTSSTEATGSPTPSAVVRQFSPDGILYPPQIEWGNYELGLDGMPVRSSDGKRWRQKRGKKTGQTSSTETVVATASQANEMAMQLSVLPPDTLGIILTDVYCGGMSKFFGEGFTPSPGERDMMIKTSALWLSTVIGNPSPLNQMLIAFGSFTAMRFVVDDVARNRLLTLFGKKKREETPDLFNGAKVN